MGLAEIDQQCWLAEPITPAELARKRRLLRDQRELVLRRVPGSEAIEAAVVGAIARVLEQRGQMVDAGAEGLEAAALWVADDLCLLAADPAGHRLVSACLCSPSYWRLGDKIGKPMVGIHGPVRGLNQTIGSNVQHFLDKLPLGRIFQRRNWLIHQSDDPYHPHDEAWPATLRAEDCQNLFVRSETQTLRKFAGGAVLFTIRVRSHPLAQISDYPQAAADMLIGMDRMSDDERRAFGYHHHGEALRAFLLNLTARSA